LHGEIGPTLVHKTIPMLLGMIALMSFNLIDTYFVGKLGTRELAAMGFTFPAVLTIISLGLGLGTGASSVIARAIGQGDHHLVKVLTTNTLLLSGILSVTLSVIGLLTMGPVFTMLGAPPDILPMVREYMMIWYVGLVFIIIPMVGNHAIRATGDTLFPAILMVISSVMNVILDPILIFGYFGFPAMRLAGAALATVIARVVTLVAALLVLYYRERMLSFERPNWKEVSASLRDVLYIGIPAAGVNLLVSISTGIVTRLLADFGTLAVASFGVASRIQAFFLHIYMALASVLSPFAGQNWGGQQYARVRRALSLSFRFSWIMGCVTAVFLAVCAGPIMRLFNPHPEVVAIGRLFFWIVPLSYGAEGIIMFSSSVFSALGRPIISIVIVGMRMLIVFVPVVLIGKWLYGIAGIFAGITVTNFCVCLGVYFWNRRFFSPK